MNRQYSVRFADAADAAAVWSLYLRTGFLYPQKLEAMGDGGRQARATLEALLAMASSDYRILLCLNEAEQLRCAFAYGCFANSQAWCQHMVSDQDRGALLQGLASTKIGLTELPVHWVAYTFRENNASVQRLFTRPLAQARQAGWSIEFATYDFYSVTGDAPRRLQALDSRRQVRRATELDRLFLLGQMEDDSEVAALQALGSWKEGAGVGALARRLARAGLPRERAAAVVEDEDGPCALAVLDWSAPWWNLSNLSTGLRLWQRGEDPAASAALLSWSARWFAERAVPHWTLLLGAKQRVARDLLEGVGLTSSRRYQRLGYPIEAAPWFHNAYTRSVGRSAAALTVPDLRQKEWMTSGERAA